MRSLRLLLSAGAMLSLAAGSAYAGRIMDMTGNPATPTGTGLVTNLDGFQEMGGPYTGGQGLETESAIPFSVPAPGTVNMRVNSFVNEFPMITWFSGQNANGTPESNAGNKMQGYGIYGWIRIDLGIDGQTKNGIKYGAFTEIRENNTTAITGTSAPVSSGFGQGASTDSSDNTLYVRNATVYLGTDQLGFVRIGSVVDAMTLYETGLNDNFDIGGWISFASSNIPGNMAPVWPWADEGGAYMPAGIAYLSPVIAGFDGGISFLPNNSTPFDGSGCTPGTYGGTNCVTQSSSQLAGDFQNRYRNRLDVALRYRNSFGPIGFDAAGTYLFSGVVNNTLSLANTPALGAADLVGLRYKGLSIGDFGAEFTINHAWQIAGNVMWGNVNGNWTLQPDGGSNALGWEVGTEYTFMQAPLTIGTYYFNYNYNGLTTPRTAAFHAAGVGQRTSRGLDVGAVYGLGPGVVLIAEYAWGENSQNGFDFLTNAVGPDSNKVWAQVLTAGMSVRF
jgi:Gram-negative porin